MDGLFNDMPPEYSECWYGFGRGDMAQDYSHRRNHQKFISTVKKYAFYIIIFAIIMGFVGYAWACRKPDVYTATATIYVVPNDNGMAASKSDARGLYNAQVLSLDVEALALSRRVMNDAAASLGLDDLGGFSVSVKRTFSTRVVTVSVTSTSPIMTYKVAGGIADATAKLTYELTGLNEANVLYGSIPATPSGPYRYLYALVGMGAGFLFAVGVMYVVSLFDTRVKSGKEASQIVGVPALAYFPMCEIIESYDVEKRDTLHVRAK